MIEDLSSAPTEAVLALLASTSRLLATATDYEAALQGIGDLLVPSWVDGCAIGLTEDDGLRIVCRRGTPPVDWSARRRVAKSTATRPSGRSGWVLDVPIAARPEPIGMLRLTGAGDRPPEILRPLGEELALRIAMTIEAARAIAREHHVADTLQRALLPDRLPRTAEVSFDAAYLPATTEAIVGGDWYDAFELPDGRIAMSIGDVAGHGLSAAVIMSEVRQALRAAALTATIPSEVLGRANQMLTMRSNPTMVTALYGTYDPSDSTFTYATAGQPAPLLGTPDGRVQSLPSGGVPLGIVDEIETSDWTFSLLPGSLLVLYTDGLIEFARDLFAGEAALTGAVAAEIAEPTSAPAQSLLNRVFAKAANTDDAATLTLSVTPRPQDTFAFTFSAIPVAAPLVRRALERYANERGLNADQTFALIGAVGEAVANAVEHAYDEQPGIVRLTVEGEERTLRVQVEDSGRWRPAQRREERGRGIPLMRALMNGVEIRTGRSSTQVRMRLDLV